MRLGPLLLTGAALWAPMLLAQARQPLAWERLAPLGWQVTSGSLPEGTPGDLVPSSGPLVVRVTEDGTLRVLDGKGLLRLQAGLPGRPLRAWRDGGLDLPAGSGSWTFPLDTPLAKGLGGLRWGSEDFRPFLRGLLWILEDGEGFLTVVHPATAHLIHLPLPAGRELRVRFLADRLEVVAGDVDKGAPRQWSLPWMGLLPALAALGPQPAKGRAGTALLPFAKD